MLQRPQIVLRGLIALGCLALTLPPASALDVPVTVKESAGVPIDEYPISVVVPLPYGQYQDVSQFSLGTPAQFQVLNRWATRDNSIRHVIAHFQTTVGSMGDTVLRFRDNGGNSAPTSPVTVTNGASLVTVDTGPLRFTVNKTDFSILETVWFDQDGNGSFTSAERVILPDANHGGVLDGCNISSQGSCVRDIQRDQAMAAPSIVIEESGPLRAVIRAELPATYVDSDNDGLAEHHDHGYAVRIYAFAGKPFIKIDYQLQNSAKGPDLTDDRHADPMYFNALDLDFNLQLGSSPAVTVGRGDDTFYSQSLGNGVVLAQEFHDTYTIRNASSGSPLESTCSSDCRAPGFIDVSDSNRGVTAVIRNYWQMWPNGLQVDSGGKLSAQLWPDWSAHWYDDEISPSGLYWLKDMQHTYKEVLLAFHGSETTQTDMLNLARAFQYHPVPTLPVSWYKSTGVTLDLDGKIPLDTHLGTDERTPTFSTGKLGWVNFAIDGRKKNCEAGGGWPTSDEYFVATEDPADYWRAEGHALGELNVRPQWMADYSYEDDWDRLQLSQGYASGHWRDSSKGTFDVTGTGHDACARDDQHGWFYPVEEAYFYTGNPWIKDWYGFVGEFRKPTLDDRSGAGPGTNGRGRGHPLHHALQAYRVTGDTTIIDKIEVYLRETLRPRQHTLYGMHQKSSTGNESAFSTGYLVRPVIDYMREIEDSDSQAYAEAFNYVSGLMEWNLNWSNFGYWDRPPVVRYSSGTALTFVDAQSWYYWHTGNQAYIDHLNDYLEDHAGPRQGIPDGYCTPVPSDPPYEFCYEDSDCPGSSCDLSEGGNDPYGDWDGWVGQYESRYWEYIEATTRTDWSAPAAVGDLTAALNASTLALSWTAPAAADAARYHLVWSSKPISWEHTQDETKTNWWAGEAVGTDLVPQPGASQALSIDVGATSPVYAALFTFDAAGNMSEMSNVALALEGGGDDTPPSAPTNLNAVAQGTDVIDLTWTASSDPQSGISNYRIYRDGALHGFSSVTEFSDTGLAEATTYSYRVSAVNGVGLESPLSGPVNETTGSDTTPPAIASVVASGATSVTVVFDEAVEEASATATSNYSVAPGISVESAVLASDLVTVVLGVSTMVSGTEYTLTVSGVRDRASTPNTIAPGSTASFTYTSIVTLDMRISNGADDIEEEPDGTVRATSADLELGEEGSTPQTVGLRFRSVPIPPGAVVVNATLQFVTDETTSDACELLIEGEASDDAEVFGSVGSRPRTASSVAWSPPPWNIDGEAGPAQRTGNLATVLQQIVGRPGWSAGNALVLIISGSGTRVAAAYESDSNLAPLLHVEYSFEAATDPPEPPGGLVVD